MIYSSREDAFAPLTIFMTRWCAPFRHTAHPRLKDRTVEGFTVILRDIMVILAASALVAMSVFGVLVLWQLYRLGRELHSEMQPILASVQDTAETVHGAARFISGRMSERVSAVVSLGYTAHAFYQLVQQFYRGLGRGARPAAPARAVSVPPVSAPMSGSKAPSPGAGPPGLPEG